LRHNKCACQTSHCPLYVFGRAYYIVIVVVRTCVCGFRRRRSLAGACTRRMHPRQRDHQRHIHRCELYEFAVKNHSEPTSRFPVGYTDRHAEVRKRSNSGRGDTLQTKRRGIYTRSFREQRMRFIDLRSASCRTSSWRERTKERWKK